MKSQVINLETYVESGKDPDVFKAYKKINSIFDMQNHEYCDLKILSKELIKVSNSNKNRLSGFFLDKTIEITFREQFDLLRFSNNTILNIELKHKMKSLEEIEDQLIRHNYLLGCIKGDRQILLYTFISSENKVFKLKDEKLVKSSIKELFSSIPDDYIEKNLLLDLNPDDFIISPYTDIDRFLNTRYFLNSEQKKIIVQETTKLSNYNVMIKGGPGTGKSLILFDLAKKLSKRKKSVLLIFCSALSNWCEINSKVNFDFKDIREIDFKNIEMLTYDYIILDESQRLRKNQFESLFKTNSILIFAVDKEQTLKPEEKRLDVEGQLDDSLDDTKKYKLKEKVRNDESLSTFIQKFFDKGKKKLQPIEFPKVNAVYFDDKHAANIFIENLIKFENYTSIEAPQYQTRATGAIKNKKIYPLSLDGFNVIGREFDNVLIPIDNRLTYSNNKLRFEHNENYYPYLAIHGFFQAVTRVKQSLLFVVINNKKMFIELQQLITWKYDKSNIYTANRLKLLRETNKSHIDEICKACKCNKKTYEDIESTGIFPNNKVLQKMSNYYNVSSDFLMGYPTELSYTDFDILYQSKCKGKSKNQKEQINKQLINFLKSITD